jgi:hypothetical protein
VLLADGSISIFGLFLGGVMPYLLLLTSAWSSFLDFAFFRSALGLGRLRAIVATVLVLLVYVGLGGLWYVLSDQLGPLVGSGVD